MYEVILRNGEMTEKIHELNGTDRRVLSCSYSEGINTVSTAQFVITPMNPAYPNIVPLSSKIEIVNTLTNHVDFEGRIMKMPSASMDADGKIKYTYSCEGFLSYFYDSIQQRRKFDSITADVLMEDITARHSLCIPEEKIYKTEFTVKDALQDVEVPYCTTFEAVKSLLLDKLGGELSITREDGNLVVHYDYPEENPTVSETVIELAKNMKTISAADDFTTIITRLIPLGAKINDDGDQLTIRSVNDGLDYITDTAMEEKYKQVVYKYVDFSRYDGSSSPAALKAMGEKYLKNNNRSKKSYKAKILDLSAIGLEPESIVVGKTYHFVNRLFGLDENLRVVSKTVDIFNAHCPSVEIGEKTPKLTFKTAKTEKKLEEVEERVDEEEEEQIESEYVTKGEFNIYVTQMQEYTDALDLWRDGIDTWKAEIIAWKDEQVEPWRVNVSVAIEYWENQTLALADRVTALENAEASFKHWKGTQAEYDALEAKDSSTIYIIWG